MHSLLLRAALLFGCALSGVHVTVNWLEPVIRPLLPVDTVQQVDGTGQGPALSHSRPRREAAQRLPQGK